MAVFVTVQAIIRDFLTTLSPIGHRADTGNMINIFPTRSTKSCLLISSDQRNRTEARREIAQWAAERDLALPRHPRRLALVEDNAVVAEWVVIEHPERPEPTPPGHSQRLMGHLTLVPGGRAA
jgi:hypothetical protein